MSTLTRAWVERKYVIWLRLFAITLSAFRSYAFDSALPFFRCLNRTYNQFLFLRTLIIFSQLTIWRPRAHTKFADTSIRDQDMPRTKTKFKMVTTDAFFLRLPVLIIRSYALSYRNYNTFAHQILAILDSSRVACCRYLLSVTEDRCRYKIWLI